MTTFDYPVWLRVDHWLNVLFVTLIIRSGIEILATRCFLEGEIAHAQGEPKLAQKWFKKAQNMSNRDEFWPQQSVSVKELKSKKPR